MSIRHTLSKEENLSTGKKRNAKGQGHFKELSDGRIEYRKSAGLNTNGKRKILVVVGTSKSACIKLMKDKEDEWNARKALLSVSGADTVEELCTRHLNSQVENDELKPKSVDRREGTIKNQIEAYPLGHMQIQAVVASDIDDHINKLIKSGLSVSSVKKALDVLSAAYDWAIARGELTYNPVTSIKKSITKRLSKLESKAEADADVIVLSPDEIERFNEECIKKHPTGAYMYAGGLYGRLLLHTGMRVGEMISLRWSDYDEEEHLLTINKSTSVVKNRNKKDGESNYIAVQGTTKNQKARVLRLSDEAIEDLELIKKLYKYNPTDLICRTRNKNQYTATMMEHCIKSIYKNLSFGEHVSGLHILRRTFATQMYDNGADVKEIAAYIGDLESTTMQYYIAARKKIVVGTTTKQIVPMPGSRKNKNENAPANDKGIVE